MEYISMVRQLLTKGMSRGLCQLDRLASAAAMRIAGFVISSSCLL